MQRVLPINLERTKKVNEGFKSTTGNGESELKKRRKVDSTIYIHFISLSKPEKDIIYIVFYDT